MWRAQAQMLAALITIVYAKIALERLQSYRRRFILD